MTYKTKGIILKRRNFGEADRILTIYTQNEGKITAIAKGVRRSRAKMVGHVELFYKLNLQLAEGKSFDILTSAEIVNEFANLRKNQQLTNTTYLLGEVLDSLTHENEKNLPLYNLLEDSLSRLEKGKTGLLIPYFIHKVLQLQGHQPHTLDECSKCRQKLDEDGNYFSNQFGGVICQNCLNFDLSAKKISPNSIKLMRLFSQNPVEVLDKITIKEEIEKELPSILINFVQYIIEKPIKSFRFLNG